jgi:iron complex transport system ATP-binding protein
VIGVSHLSVTLGGRMVLYDVSLTAAPGELVALCGPNGAGKSTLLRALAGLLPEAPTPDPRRVVWLEQGARCAWGLTVEQVAALGRIPHHDAAVEPITRALQLCGIERLRKSRVDRISGGEARRAMLARAFATEPEVFLLDEPTADLDPAASHAIMRLLRTTADSGRAVVVVLHAVDLALRYAHRVVVLRDGRVTVDVPAESALPAAAAASIPRERGTDGADSRLLRTPNDGRKSRLPIAGAISIALHAVLLAGLLPWFSHAPPSGDVPDSNGAVELVMVEQKGAGPTTAPPEAAPPAPVPTPEAQPMPPTPLPPPAAETAEESLPLPPPPAPPPSAPQPVSPPVQQAQEAPEINIGGNDSETNAIASGPHVMPASVDARAHNQEPVYPLEAVRHAQQGAVILLIHVSPVGLPLGVDVVRSSGFVLLDRAAREAVTNWHFLPAVKDGQPIPFDMALRVVFHLD